MNVSKRFFSLVALSLLTTGLTAPNAHADVFYQPYYYELREQNMAKTPLQGDVTQALQAQQQPSSTVSHSQTPDPRLNDSTNQRLATGVQPDYVPVPKLNPVKAPMTATTTEIGSDKIELGTSTIMELGVQLSHYHYQEHLVPDQKFMHLSGDNFGLSFAGTKAYRSGLFWGGDARLTYGWADYTGSDQDIYGNIYPSSRDKDPTIIAEIRTFLGHDYVFNNALWGAINFSLSPYAGLGFRYLRDEANGTDTNGVVGYNRESRYIYMPIGITPRFRITDNSRISLNAEYDQFLYGWQVSSISGGDITNGQDGGYGLRGNVMFEQNRWAFGPFANYWNINQSNLACSTAFCGVEPHNQTYEYGMQLKYRFTGF